MNPIEHTWDKLRAGMRARPEQLRRLRKLSINAVEQGMSGTSSG